MFDDSNSSKPADVSSAPSPSSATTKKKRGFAGMTPERQREIAAKGGRTAHEKGTAHQFTKEEAQEAGRRGGKSVSADAAHMAAIGKLGGQAVAKNKQHMADIGKLGGRNGGRNRRLRAAGVPEGEEP